MDNYLESLVLKGEKPEEATTESVEEAVVAEIAEAVAEPESEATPEPDEEVEAKDESPEEAVLEEASAPEEKPVTVTIKAEDTNNGIVKHPDVPLPTPEEPTAVIDIRIYNTPDPKGPFKFFSGNVMVRDKVDEMTMIEYMKPGFGLVKGFTPDLK